MRLWIELSGEHPTLPRAEALAAFEAEGVVLREMVASSRILRLDASGPAVRAAGRIGLAHFVCEELVRGDLDALREFARGYDLGGKTFRTRVQPVGADVDRKALEGPLGADFGRTGRVDLTAPEVDFRVLVGEELSLGRVIVRVDRRGLESRKVTKRVFRKPVTLHPKLARALVNLSRVPTGGLLADPFCGTGGIVLEASRMGLRPVGSDIKRSMAAGARDSLRALGAQAAILLSDAGHAPWRRGVLDGIATDPPYGRAATTHGEPPRELYERAFEAFDESLRPRSYVAVILPDDRAVEVGQRRWELVERHAVRVHKSLTRNFCAFVT